jgi:hypothetical protein
MGGGVSVLHNSDVNHEKIAGIIAKFTPEADVEAIKHKLEEDPSLLDQEVDQLLLQVSSSRLRSSVAFQSSQEEMLEEGDSHDRTLATSVMKKIMVSFANHFVIAVDGSEASHNAFMMAMRLRRGEDHIQVLHCYREDQEGLPDAFKANSIKERYESELVCHLPHQFFSVNLRPKIRDIETPKVVAHYINNQAVQETLVSPDTVPNFLFMGVVGRKGPKEDPTVLGRTAYESLQFSHIPVILVRKPIPEDKTALTYVLSVTASDRSKHAFRLLLPLLKPRDRLVVLHVSYDPLEVEDLPASAHPDAIRRYYEKEVEENAPVGSSFHSIEHVPGQPVHETIAAFVEEQEADFLALAPRYRQSLSSTTSHLLQKSKMNLILFKN